MYLAMPHAAIANCLLELARCLASYLGEEHVRILRSTSSIVVFFAEVVGRPRVHVRVSPCTGGVRVVHVVFLLVEVIGQEADEHECDEGEAS